MWDLFLSKAQRLHRRNSRSGFKPVILVTGCSSGVGLALARRLFRHSEYRVVATARSSSCGKLREQLAENENFWIRELDITSAESRRALLHEIETKWHGVDILINNAGISYRAVFEHMDEKTELHQMTTNYLGPAELIRSVLPNMRLRGRGKIINVSSVSGMLAMPTMSSYSASKYALEGMSEALWYELRPLGINVSLIQPGFIRSKSFKNVYYTEKSKQGSQSIGLYGDYYQNIEPFIERLMKLSLTTPQSVASRILKVIKTQNPPLWIPVTADAHFFYYLRRFVPRRLLLPFLFFALPNSRKWAKDHSNKRRP